jgi:hypothetical protein
MEVMMKKEGWRSEEGVDAGGTIKAERWRWKGEGQKVKVES